MGERRSVHEVQDEDALAPADLEVPDTDDVRLGERAERLELAAQALPPGLVGEHDGMEALDRDGVTVRRSRARQTSAEPPLPAGSSRR
jgi:hypothetical protein